MRKLSCCLVTKYPDNPVRFQRKMYTTTRGEYRTLMSDHYAMHNIEVTALSVKCITKT